MKKHFTVLTLSIICALISVATVAAQPESQAETDFRSRIQMLGERGELFASFMGKEVSSEERDAYMFLVAYCPLCDIADMEPGYFLNQVRGAFRAREYFAWGRTVPENIFNHFVLPHRVNNENLDEARDVFFDELKERIKGMSMYDAALEVNHWCHEKVEYRATDPRTSAPLALVKTSWGRCGEESAFTATALRAVGIPARQVYTPRWVHTDSNHAWVEVWVDGRWHYLGACEPEPDLDMAWFTVPATRAMMMHTTVFGKYSGPEEVNLATDLYTTINLLGTYAPTRKVTVTVTGQDGSPVEGADVKFKVYNYSEFFPLVSGRTGPDGRASLTTGYGDVLVWASRGEEYGYIKVEADSNEAFIVMEAAAGREYSEDFVMNVPAETPQQAVESARVGENRRRLAHEDSIRNAYMATFADEPYASKLAAETGLDREKVWYFIREAQGNWQQIASFILNNARNPYLIPFLESLYPKDLRDTPAAYLADHLTDLPPEIQTVPDEIVASKILSPRIDMEIIAPWRGYLARNLFDKSSGLGDPDSIVQYVRDNVKVDARQNYVACLLTPEGVHKTGVADVRSRNVYFVALCKTAGIPAHIERTTGKPQFWKDGHWHDALFDDGQTATVVPPRGKVTFSSAGSNPVEPAYRTHYTIARYSGGDFHTLDLSRELSGKSYPVSVEVPAGYYRFITGSRANDGSVAVHTEYFELPEGKNTALTVSLPAMADKLFVEGILDMNTIVFLPDGTKTTLKEQSNGRGLILVFADPATEPTRHVLQEMPAFSKRLEEWGGGILFVEQGEKGSEFNRSIFRDIPSQSVWMTDQGGALLGAATESLRMEFTNEYPLTLYLNSSGGILFSHKGYRLGLVESLWKTINTERQMLN